MMIRQFPGKLYLMGEYFVTADHGEAIVMAVDRFIETSTRMSDRFQLNSDYGKIIDGETPSSDMNNALEAVRLSYEYLNYLNIKPKALNINIKSSLLENGIKIGLGSSAVILVAIIQSILESHEVILDNLKIFKLSVLCQKKLGDLSSGGDLAASIYSGLVYYKKYENQWLKEQNNSFELIEKNWPGLSIKKLEMPKDIELMFAWTGKPNKTDNYLKIFNTSKIRDSETYQKFTKRAHRYVNMFVEGSYERAIFEYRALMLELEIWTRLDIETKELKQAIDIALRHQAYAKISGSGGGDCMFAMLAITKIKNKDLIIDEWTKNNIKYLELGVWDNDSFTKKR